MSERFYCFTMLVLSFAITGCTDVANSPATTSAESETPVVFNAAGAPTVEISVPDMMCPESCAVQTKEILSEQPGAREVIVNFEAKTATVAIEAGKFDADAAIAALVDHGFDHSTRKSAADEAKATSEATGQPAG